LFDSGYHKAVTAWHEQTKAFTGPISIFCAHASRSTLAQQHMQAH